MKDIHEILKYTEYRNKRGEDWHFFPLSTTYIINIPTLLGVCVLQCFLIFLIKVQDTRNLFFSFLFLYWLRTTKQC